MGGKERKIEYILGAYLRKQSERIEYVDSHGFLRNQVSVASEHVEKHPQA